MKKISAKQIEKNELQVKQMEKNELNALARLFYKMQGYEVPDDFDFSASTHPSECQMYELARVSGVFWRAKRRANT